MKWDLYDKEVGTWCAPDTTELPKPVYQSTQPSLNQRLEMVEMRPVPDYRQTASNPSMRIASLASGVSTSPDQTQSLTRWADAALRIIRSQVSSSCDPYDSSCKETPSGNQSLINRPVASSMNLYVAMPTNLGKMMAVLPDGALSKTGARDAWLLLDPTPQLAFGHTVHVFTIDLKVPDSYCISNGGTPLGKIHIHYKLLSEMLFETLTNSEICII